MLAYRRGWSEQLQAVVHEPLPLPVVQIWSIMLVGVTRRSPNVLDDILDVVAELKSPATINASPGRLTSATNWSNSDCCPRRASSDEDPPWARCVEQKVVHFPARIPRWQIAPRL